MIGSLFSNPLSFFIYIIALLIAITVHECCHAVAADKLGDPTPSLQGRISLNPLVHIDPIGGLLILLFGFGWGKPVQFDPFNLKNPRKDAAIISIAGPASNFALAVLGSILLRLMPILHATFFFGLLSIFLASFIQVNIILGVFNLLPIAPLDGFKIVGGLLPRDKAHEWYQLERYGIFFLLALLIPFGSSSMLQTILSPISAFFMNFLLPQNFM